MRAPGTLRRPVGINRRADGLILPGRVLGFCLDRLVLGPFAFVCQALRLDGPA
jgi:hypothetical protein